MTDKKGRKIDCYLENTFLVIFIYTGVTEVNEMRESIVDKMKAY